ncbi:MAG: family 10 glycosylhydrolase [Candidatus Wallbacteria bacterium]|nr:family 10 glycosylhydrolase [Candidatus Wallbacteria bacterium]
MRLANIASPVLTSVLLLLLAGGAAAGTERGVWVRPTANLAAIDRQFADIVQAGFDTIYLETFYHGFAIYPSRVVPERPGLESVDLLDEYVTRARAAGLRIHAWLQSFYWQADTKLFPQVPRSPLLDEHPEWRTKLANGKATDSAERGHFFANPAHPEVRALLASLTEEILSRYPVDGITLDYIRYPFGFIDAGYDETTRDLYRGYAGVDPVELFKNPLDPRWRQWVEFREDQVIAAVRAVRDAKQRIRPQAVLSAAIFPSSAWMRYTDTRCQNWRKMLRLGLLDAILPMCYQPSLAGLREEIRTVKAAMGPGLTVRLVPVLAVGQKISGGRFGTDHPPMARQVAAARLEGVSEFSVFCLDWIRNSVEGLDLLSGTETAKPTDGPLERIVAPLRRLPHLFRP